MPVQVIVVIVVIAAGAATTVPVSSDRFWARPVLAISLAMVAVQGLALLLFLLISTLLSAARETP